MLVGTPPPPVSLSALLAAQVPPPSPPWLRAVAPPMPPDYPGLGTEILDFAASYKPHYLSAEEVALCASNDPERWNDPRLMCTEWAVILVSLACACGLLRWLLCWACSRTYPLGMPAPSLLGTPLRPHLPSRLATEDPDEHQEHQRWGMPKTRSWRDGKPLLAMEAYDHHAASRTHGQPACYGGHADAFYPYDVDDDGRLVGDGGDERMLCDDEDEDSQSDAMSLLSGVPFLQEEGRAELRQQSELAGADRNGPLVKADHAPDEDNEQIPFI